MANDATEGNQSENQEGNPEEREDPRKKEIADKVMGGYKSLLEFFGEQARTEDERLVHEVVDVYLRLKDIGEKYFPDRKDKK